MNPKIRSIVPSAALIAALAVFAGLMWIARCRILANAAAVTNAADRGDWATVMRLVPWRQSLADATDGHGQKLIHLAVWAGRTDVVEFLAHYGANMDALTISDHESGAWTDDSPLTLAIKYAKADMVECLLKNGADPNSCAHEHYLGYAKVEPIQIVPVDDVIYPLPWAMSHGHPGIAAVLKKYGAKKPPATSTSTP